MTSLESFVRGLPKTDLHMHIEGSIEPQLMLDLAARNGMKLRWATAEALRSAYRFTSLQSFLDLYFEGCKVLVAERDFHGVTRAELFIGRRASLSAASRLRNSCPACSAPWRRRGARTA